MTLKDQDLARAYQVLGVDPDVSDKELRKAWKALITETHPDVRGDDPDAAAEAAEINAAHQTILAGREEDRRDRAKREAVREEKRIRQEEQAPDQADASLFGDALRGRQSGGENTPAGGKEGGRGRERERREPRERKQTSPKAPPEPASASSTGATTGTPPVGEGGLPPWPEEALPGARRRSPNSQSSQAAAHRPKASFPPKEVVARLVNVGLACAVFVLGVLLMNADKGSEKGDAVGAHSTGHYGGEALLGVLALVLMVGGIVVVVWEVARALSGKSPLIRLY